MPDFTSRSEIRRLAMQAPDKLIEKIEDLEKKLVKARNALDTYAQFDERGEVTFVSGRLAKDTIEDIGGDRG